MHVCSCVYVCVLGYSCVCVFVPSRNTLFICTFGRAYMGVWVGVYVVCVLSALCVRVCMCGIVWLSVVMCGFHAWVLVCVYLCACVFVCLFKWLYVCLFVCLVVYLFVLVVCLFVCLVV